jgi:hypothetical protein
MDKSIEDKNSQKLKIRALTDSMQIKIDETNEKINQINKHIQQATGFEQESLHSQIANLKAELEGLRVKKEDNTIGVQFTIAEGKLDKKEKQIAKAKEKISKNNDNGLMLDDLVVVHMPMNYAKKVYMEWKHNPRPGGPEKTLPVDIQETIITGVLQGLFREEEIKEIVAKTIERN